MHDRVTDLVRKSIALAGKAARAAGHDRTDVEHVAIGLLRSGSGLFSRLRVDARKLEAEIERRLVRGHPSKIRGELSFAPSVQSLLQAAIDEADELRDSWVGTEHLLLAILGSGSHGVVSRALANAGVRRDAVLELLGAVPGGPERIL